MTNGFDWVPFFNELSQKILPYRNRQRELVSMLMEAGVKGVFDQNPKGTVIPLVEIDPFTFVSLITKHGDSGRSKILKVVKAQLGISSRVPNSFFGVPNVDSRQAWLFAYKYDRRPEDIAKLWNLFEEVVIHGLITETAFSEARKVKYAGSAKLTQAIFRASPQSFFPVDSQTIPLLQRLRLPSIFKSAEEYRHICEQIRDATNKSYYELSHEAWLANQQLPVTEGQYQRAALNKAASKSSKEFREAPGGIPVPPKIHSPNGNSYYRNPSVAAEALRRAGFRCELDPTHATFISSVKNEPYVEAHHLVPISIQSHFTFNLDVMANVVALCPLCHRLLHHGKLSDKKELLIRMLESRKSALMEKEIYIDKNDLFNYYSKDLQEEEA